MEPLAVAIVWNKEDQDVVQDYIDYTTELLSSDIDNPFSRTINLPMFYYVNIKNDDIPPKIMLKAEKLVVYVFISLNSFSCGKWGSYIEDLYNIENANIVPIALDTYAFNISPLIKNYNFIRAYEFDENKKQRLFIAMAHEIYRYGFNEKKTICGENALKIFLSHAKDGVHGLNLAKQLKTVIDNSSMQRFFDTNDIAPGYRFDDVIINNLKTSSIIIINSDIYSTRYWCQREIQVSKEYERPIIEVDLIIKGMDRKFPFAGNVPVVRADMIGDQVELDDLYRILETILLETIRYNYVDIKLEYLTTKITGRVKKMCRPPEMIDLQKIIKKDKDTLAIEYDYIVYPDPPIYSEEIDFFTQLGMEIYTPIEFNKNIMLNKNIGISISEPLNEELIQYGQNKSHLDRLSQTVSKYILGGGATLIYGGDLRKNGYTEQLLMEAAILKDRLKSDDIHLINYISWPIYLSDTKEVKEWNAKYNRMLTMKEVDIDETVKKLVSDSKTFIAPDSVDNWYAWSKSLTKMRYSMIKECNARVCAGGRSFGYKGKMPGVLEEVLIAAELKCPIYLLGGFGGVVHSICELIEGANEVETLTEEWQINNNLGYSDILTRYEDNNEKIDYSLIADQLKNIDLNNGLTSDENERLFNTVYVDEAVQLVLKGLKSI